MKAFLLILITTLTFNIYAGDRVWNGGGLAEKNILWALVSLDKYIDNCLNGPYCNLTKKEKTLLKKIKKVHLTEPQGPNFIKFKSHIKNEENFDFGEGIKLAKTKLKPGSPIFINKDLLYRNINGNVEAFTVAEAVSLLIHEIGHHTGEKNHTKLDLLGAKVGMVVERFSEKAPFFPTNNKIQVVSFNSDSLTQFPEILIYIDDQIINITEKVKKEIECHDDYRSRPEGATFHNIYWKPFYKRSDSLKFKFQGNLWVFCQNRNGFIYDKPEGKYLEVSFKSKIIDESKYDEKRYSQFKVNFVPGSLDIEVKKMWMLVGEGNPLDAIPGN